MNWAEKLRPVQGPEDRLRIAAAAAAAQGRAVQVDPGFSQLTPRLLSALETKT